jgi:hypothetical protein
MGEEELRREVRLAAEEMCLHGADLLNLSEREQLVNEVLDETFGLGPLEALMRDPTISDIMINGPNTAFVERRGRLERSTSPSTTRSTCCRSSSGSPGGSAAGRREQPDGRRAAGRRQPRQRDHPAAVAQGHAAVDPALPLQAAAGDGP